MSQTYGLLTFNTAHRNVLRHFEVMLEQTFYTTLRKISENVIWNNSKSQDRPLLVFLWSAHRQFRSISDLPYKSLKHPKTGHDNWITLLRQLFVRSYYTFRSYLQTKKHCWINK
jgi:hypothetical protein